MRGLRRRIAVLSVVALPLVGGTGCFPGYLKLKVTSEPTTNNEAPFYMVVRSVDSKAFLVESYGDVAPKVVTPDNTVLKSVLLYPGTPATVWVKVPKKAGVGVYFLFTAPSEPWRILFEEPVPSTADLELQGNRLRPEVHTSSVSTEAPAAPSAKPEK